MSRHFQAIAVLIAISSPVASQAQVQALGQHPAVIVHARAQTIDPNLFIVQPPASVVWSTAHANAEHPAVLVARRGASTGIDTNTFQVQPPATTTWTMGPAAEAPLLVARSIADGR